MSKPIITVENLSKRYHLGQIGATTLRDSAQQLWHRLRGQNPDYVLGKAAAPSSSDSGFKLKLPLLPPDSGFKSHPSSLSVSSDDLWALRDVSFEVNQGEVLGIIGRNGAGKSTLLKILSRITEPTSGRAVIRGRVASLLEVGTGFHPELTGRENIFLNGAILGMKKGEIAKKFDEIVAFSEVERFIDTPVKRYSSGMYVRLAFAVAAHLEPEILIVDEVLAVGDVAFQKKCLGKMGDVARNGRTVLFVSHNMAAVVALCSDCIWLQGGELFQRGSATVLSGAYLGYGRSEVHGDITPSMHAHTPKGLCFQRVRVVDGVGHECPSFLFGQPMTFEVEFDIPQDVKAVRMGLTITREDSSVITVLHYPEGYAQDYCGFASGRHCATVTCTLPLAPGSYRVGLFAKPAPGFWSSGHQSMDFVEYAVGFAVAEVSIDGQRVLSTGAPIASSSIWSLRRNS
jgi:lipopolysaccharide transport system ATP-binding protein